MRVIMLCRLYYPHIGGVERHVEEIAKEAAKEGHRVDVFALKHANELATWEMYHSTIHIHRKPEQLHSHILKYFFAALPFFPKSLAAKIVERDEIWGWMLWNLPRFIMADIIHIHDVFFWYWPIRILLPWKKVYITFHGFETGSLPTQKAKAARQRAARWTRGNIAVGGWIENWYGTKADIVTYGAANCADEPKALKEKSGKKIRCVFVGRVADDTGARVYEKVIGTLPGVALDMYGAGSKNGTIDDSCVVFPHYDVACVSSYLSIIEAMQSKTLVLAYAVDDLKWDYLKSHPMAENMIIVRTENELRKTILRLSVRQLADQDDKVEKAYIWAREQTWDTLYKQYKELWLK
jgi:hypothetical protein